MAFASQLLARIRFRPRAVRAGKLDSTIEIETLVRAHGDCLALLATILEREHVIGVDEFARSLREFAAYTAADRPAEGHILLEWAASLQDQSIRLRDEPLLH